MVICKSLRSNNGLIITIKRYHRLLKTMTIRGPSTPINYLKS